MDIIFTLNFYNYLNDNYINLLCINKHYYKLLDDNIYKLILSKKFSNNFIDKVKLIIITWKDCYIRIKKFEYLTLKYSYNIWSEEDYFCYWKCKYKNLEYRDIYSYYYNNYNKKIIF